MLLNEGVEIGDWVDPVSGFKVRGCVILLDGDRVCMVFGLGSVGLLNVEKSCHRLGVLEACWVECFYCWVCPSL